MDKLFDCYSQIFDWMRQILTGEDKYLTVAVNIRPTWSIQLTAAVKYLSSSVNICPTWTSNLTAVVKYLSPPVKYFTKNKPALSRLLPSKTYTGTTAVFLDLNKLLKLVNPMIFF
jgi:hypothetical protein